jgi:hypothetical protein
VNELAFALGALAHYVTDTTGHPEAVNRSVPLIFPKLRAKFGDNITYVQAPKQHVITEFSFDIVQTAAGKYQLDAYRRFIGFRVAKPLLERAFVEIYGIEIEEIFPNADRAISTYRYAVSQIIPALTEAAWRDKREEIASLVPNIEQNAFIFKYRRIDFEREYGRDYSKPGRFARLLAVIFRIVPKVGPLKPLTFKTPTPEAQQLFTRSFTDAAARYRAALQKVATGQLAFRNTDFDTDSSPGTASTRWRTKPMPSCWIGSPRESLRRPRPHYAGTCWLSTVSVRHHHRPARMNKSAGMKSRRS